MQLDGSEKSQSAGIQAVNKLARERNPLAVAMAFTTAMPNHPEERMLIVMLWERATDTVRSVALPYTVKTDNGVEWGEVKSFAPHFVVHDYAMLPAWY